MLSRGLLYIVLGKRGVEVWGSLCIGVGEMGCSVGGL